LYRVRARRVALNSSCHNLIYICEIPIRLDRGDRPLRAVMVTIRGGGELLLDKVDIVVE